MCKKCFISGLFTNNNKQMKNKKFNFKGVSQSLISGATGAGLKMAFNFALSKIDKNATLTGTKKSLVSLAVPVLAGVIAPKLVAKPLVKGAIDGHIAITMFELGTSLVPEQYKAAVSGYTATALAGYQPVSLAGRMPFSTANDSGSPLV